MKEYNIKVNGTEYTVNIKDIEDSTATLTVNGAEYEVEVQGIATKPKTAAKVVHAPVIQADAQPVARPAAASGPAKGLKSPLPGVILDVFVREGDKVKAGQKLMLLEAMKMENNIDSDTDGVVESVKVKKGDSVLEGDVLITIG